MLPTLYELAGEYRQAAIAMSDMDMDEQTIKDTLEGLSGDLETKATNVAMFTKNLESTALAIKAAEEQMAARRKALEERAKKIREYLKYNMEIAGISEIECKFFRLKIMKNPPSVVINSENLIPAEYMKIPEPSPPTPDKKAIAEAIKAGVDVAGCHMAQGTRLDIK